MTVPVLPEPPQPQDPARSAEIFSSVKRRLWEETAKGLGNVLGNLREAWYAGSDAVFYSREKERFRKYIQPFQYGLVATVFLFVNFRITGSSRFQEWRKGIWKGLRSKTPQSQAPSTPTLQLQPNDSYLETKGRKEVEKALKSMKFLTDGLLSLTVGTSGTLFLLEAKCGKDLRADYETSPLVAGRSLMADEMCPGMLELHRSDPNVRRVLDGHSTNEMDKKSQMGDPTLSTFSTFLENCQKRADHEARLRKEQRGVQSVKGPVLIPYTGVR